MKQKLGVDEKNIIWKFVKRAFVGIIVLLVIIWLGITIKDEIYKGKLRNIDEDYIEEGFTNVYADLISIEPIHFIYEYETMYSGEPYGDGKFKEIVCKCTTVEGKTIWASFFFHYYPNTKYSTKEWDYTTHTYSKETPYRIKGHIKKAERVADNLKYAIGDVLVLDVTQKQN